MIQIDVQATYAVVRRQKPLTVGLVGAKVRFSFGEDWDGLVKTAVFRQGEVTVDAVNVSSEAEIPCEVLTQPGLPVQIGLYGTNADGTVVIPTLWAETEPVQPGADPSGDTSTAAALPVYQQISAQMGALDSLETQAKDTLVAAINEANRAVCLVTVGQNEDGTYSADKSIEELSAAEDAGKVLLCYLRDVRVLTGLTGGNRGSTYVFTAVIGNTEYRVVMRENGVLCDYSTLATEQSRLPNPEKLTFAGAVQAEYDGSTPVKVDIPKLMEVALTASGDTWSADKTYAQILEAYNSGAEVRCRYRSDYVFRLTRLNSDIAEFYGLVNGVGYSIYITAGNTLTVTQTPWAKAGDIPTQTSQLENDSGYLTTAPVTSVNGQTGAVELDIPEVPGTLPNPEKLTFEGAVSATYDGSSPVVVNIPKGGSGVHVGSEPPADPSVNVWIDPEGGDGDLDLTIPDALPNPHKLTFTGAVTGEYDGSQAVTVALPEVMTVELTESNGTYTANKTQQEILAAYEAGQEVRCNYQDMLLPLVQCHVGFCAFACVYGTNLYSVLIKATDNSVIMTVTDASASGDADLSGYIPAPETAAVGQTVVVKAVDETGKPTQWEAVDMASGGTKTKIITFVDITAETDIVIAQDDTDTLSFGDAVVLGRHFFYKTPEGEQLRAKRIFGYIRVPSDTTLSTITGYYGDGDPVSWGHGDYIGNDQGFAAIQTGAVGANKYWTFEISNDLSVMRASESGSLSWAQLAPSNIAYKSLEKIFPHISGIKISPTCTFPAGSRFVFQAEVEDV